jgi:hypothetical protein
MLDQIKKLFGITPKSVETEAPYKVEAKSFEDTSDIAIAQRPAPVAKQATQAVVESLVPAKKAPAKKPAAKKPRTPKAAK